MSALHPTTLAALLSSIVTTLPAGIVNPDTEAVVWAPLGGVKIYSGLAPQGENLFPRIVLSVIFGSDELAHDGPGVPDIRVQFSIQAATLADAVTVRDQLYARLHGYAGTLGTVRAGLVSYDSESTAYADDQGIFILPIDFTFALQPCWPTGN